MAAWPHIAFINEIKGFSHDALVWGDVDNFDDEYQSDNFWWTSYAKNSYIVQWNNACAIWLLIDRCNYLEALVSGASVDMAAIINAMLAATPEEVTYFIGVADAFRQSIWDKPFNKEFYAALARGFM